MNALRFGNVLKDDKISRHQRYLVRGVVAGIGDYGNCMGVPTIGGETFFDDAYNGNILVNAFTLGTCKSDEIFYGKAEGIGNPVIYVGSKTGRDGLGGAVMSSDSFTEESKSLRPTVQVGDPFTEKLLLEACLELFKHDYIVGIQDMGAAGLTSSSFEMAGRSGSGMKMDLGLVPAREENMTPYEFMLSESQERMLICAKKGYEDKIIEIFEKWDLDVAVIGEVTDTGDMELLWHGKKVGLIPIDPITEEAPVLDRPIKEPEYLAKIKDTKIDDFDKVSNDTAFDKLFSSLEVVNKSWIYDQYDSMVQTNTVKHPGSLDASLVRIKENGKALSMSSDCNPRYCYIDPEGGAAAAVMESGRNVAMSGAKPLAITDCLNYGNPEKPETMWQFAKGCEGIKDACKALNTPVVSGNVSLYNETDGVGVFPTPSIAMVGLNEDQNKILPSVFQEDGSALYLVGDSGSEFGGSLYMKELFDKVEGTLPKIDFEKELKLWDFIIEANSKNLLKCAKDVNVGGFAIALAKMSAISGKGATVGVRVEDERDIFAESFSRAIVEVNDVDAFEEFAKKSNIKIDRIGKVMGDKFVCNEIKRDVKDLQAVHYDTFAKVIEQDI
jgi:phosphoribosylformylglycinamidine synthase